jgi:hypothetical protein
LLSVIDDLFRYWIIMSAPFPGVGIAE